MRHIALEYSTIQSAVERRFHKFNVDGSSLLAKNKTLGRKAQDMGRPRKKEPETGLEKLQAEMSF